MIQERDKPISDIHSCQEGLRRWGIAKHITIRTSYSSWKKQTRTLNTNMVRLRAKAFDVDLQHLLVVHGEARARQVVTGRVINCLMLGSTSLPVLPNYLPPFQFRPPSPFYCSLQQSVVSAFDSFSSSPRPPFWLSQCSYEPKQICLWQEVQLSSCFTLWEGGEGIESYELHAEFPCEAQLCW